MKTDNKILSEFIYLVIAILIVTRLILNLPYKETCICQNNTCKITSYYPLKKVEGYIFEPSKQIKIKSGRIFYYLDPIFKSPYCIKATAEMDLYKIERYNKNINITKYNFYNFLYLTLLIMALRKFIRDFIPIKKQ